MRDEQTDQSSIEVPADKNQQMGRTGGVENQDVIFEDVTCQVIGCAIEVHRHLGPGLLEQGYLRAMCIELEHRGISFCNEVRIPALYKGRQIGIYRIDLIVEEAVVVEIKAVERFVPVFEAQLLTYLRVTRHRVGLLMNFNSKLLRHGLQRFVLDEHGRASLRPLSIVP